MILYLQVHTYRMPPHSFFIHATHTHTYIHIYIERERERDRYSPFYITLGIQFFILFFSFFNFFFFFFFWFGGRGCFTAIHAYVFNCG